MIYKKDANFPYPILSGSSYSYNECDFTLNISLQENTDCYRFHLDYEIESEFLRQAIAREDAHLLFVVQAKDNKFFELKPGQTEVEVSKQRISLNKRTNIQLLMMASKEINFANNHDLSSFYDEVKDEITVPKYSILGYSNVVIFDGSSKKPLELFEKRLNPAIKSDVQIDLTSETIVINYKNEELQFIDSPISNQLNHAYVYMGLQKAIYRFIAEYSEDGEYVDLEAMDAPEGALDFKLYNLLKSKMVEEVSMDNVDEVIYKISDKILEKYTAAIKGLYRNGN